MHGRVVDYFLFKLGNNGFSFIPNMTNFPQIAFLRSSENSLEARENRNSGELVYIPALKSPPKPESLSVVKGMNF